MNKESSYVMDIEYIWGTTDYSIWWMNFLKTLDTIHDKSWWGLQANAINKELKEHGGRLHIYDRHLKNYENVPACVVFDTAEDAVAFKLKFG
jgi:hypothetical protein